MRNEFLPEKFPIKAMEYVEQHPMEGNMFNEFTWGGYLLFRLWPEQKVFIDGQTDFYGEKLTREYAVIYNAEPGFEELMQKYSVKWVIIRRTASLAEALDKDPVDWTMELRRSIDRDLCKKVIFKNKFQVFYLPIQVFSF